MLILDASQVHYHRVVIPLSDNTASNVDSAADSQDLKVLPGLVYKNKLYRAVKTYASNDREQAIKAARQLHLKTEGQVSILVVEASRGYGVWRQDPDLVLWRQYKAQQSLIDALNLKHVANLMRSFGGIQIRDRRHKLKTYSHCFVGEEAVAWFIRNLDIAEPEAIQLGQRLIDEGWIHHVLDEHGFENQLLFYRFYMDEENDSTQQSAS